MGVPKVLLLGSIDHAHDAIKALSEHAEIVQPDSKERSEFLKECKSGSLDGIVAIFRTFPSVAITGLFDKELADALPSSVKFLCHMGAGYDQITVDSFSKRDIRVSNVPTAVDDATADTALFLLLGALRNFNASMVSLRAGDWRGSKPAALGVDPRGRVLGILGMGGIGRNLAKKAKALGMTIAYHNRNRLSPDQEEGAEYLSFEELLRISDVLSVHVPLNDHTKHLLSFKEFKLMKQNSIIVNTARGAVINEAALVQALDDGQVLCAGLDVYENEPEIHKGLVNNPRVILLPHMGTWTSTTLKKMEEWALDNVEMAIKEGKLKSIIPEQKHMQ